MLHQHGVPENPPNPEGEGVRPSHPPWQFSRRENYSVRKAQRKTLTEKFASREIQESWDGVWDPLYPIWFPGLCGKAWQGIVLPVIKTFMKSWRKSVHHTEVCGDIMK